MSRVLKTVLLPTIALAVYVTSGRPAGQSLGSPVQADLQAYMQSRTAALQGLTRFSFGVYSDIHMIEAADWGLTRSQWQGLLRQWRDAGHVFGMIVGDLGYGNPTDPSNVLAGPAGVPDAPPVFYQMGNHETDGIGKRAWIDALYPGAVRPGSWTPQPGIAPGNADHAYYSFDVGLHTHFIVLDGNYVSFDGVTANVRQTFGQKQLDWLEADLRANTSRNILVFIHEPIDQQVIGSTPEFTLNDKGGLIDLLAAHPKQTVIFSGHFHSHSGVTKWKGVTSVHVMSRTPTPYGQAPLYGVNVAIDGEQITIANAGAVTDFNQHPMNQVQTNGSEAIVRVAEDGANSGISRNAVMTVVGPENGVAPTSGTLMLKAPAITWYTPRFISEQLIKIQPGMKFSFDIYLSNVSAGNDAVTVQPSWYMKGGQLPPKVVDQNNIQLSQRPRDGLFFLYNEDVPRLNGFATERWYHREFDLSALAGHYIDGLYLTEGATRVNVGAVYVDNIKFTWPSAGTTNAPPVVALTTPGQAATFTSPATINLTAVASDPDGTISQVSYYAGTTFLGTSSAPPYTVSWSNVPAGNYSLTALARDNLGATTTSPSVQVSVTSAPATASASAAFVGTDTATRGNWKGTYGAEGFSLAGDAGSIPPFAIVKQTGSAAWTWASLTTDARALVRAASSDRVAATWYGTTMDLDVNLVDGQTHRVSLYLLDWDARGRTMVVDALDAGSGALLDTRALSDFSGGHYVSWMLRGHVILRLKLTGGTNAVYSAVFFDSAGSGSASATTTTAAFKGTDSTTRGNWKGAYGTGGFSLANEATALPSYVVMRQTGVASWTWASSTTDVRGLQKSALPDRFAATWYGVTSDFDIDFVDGRSHDVSMYLVDWDARGRSQTIQLLDAAKGTLLDARTVTAFTGGQYWTWTVSGHVVIRVMWTGGPNWVSSGLFFDR